MSTVSSSAASSIEIAVGPQDSPQRRLDTALAELKERFNVNSSIPTYADTSNVITSLDRPFQEWAALADNLQPPNYERSKIQSTQTRPNIPRSSSQKSQQDQKRKRLNDPKSRRKQTRQDQGRPQHIGSINDVFMSTVDFMDNELSALLRRLGPKILATDLILLVNGDPPSGKSLIDQAVDRTLVKTLAALLDLEADEHPKYKFERSNVEQTPKQLWDYRANVTHRQQMCDLIDLRALRILRQGLKISLDSNGSLSDEGVRFLIEEIPRMDWRHFKRESAVVIRVPATNGLVIGAIVDAMSSLYPNPFEESFHSAGFTPGDPNLTFREVGFWEHRRNSKDSARAKDIDFTAIVFPCLMLVEKAVFEYDRDYYKWLRGHLSTRVTGSNPAGCKVHTARTLDEAYYPGLSSAALRDRNNDQVVSGPRQSRDQENGFPILIVPQLWLWKLDNTIISAHEYEEDAMYNDELEVVEDQHLQMGIFMANRVEQFGHDQHFPSSKSRSTLDIFEHRVVSVLTDVTNYTRTAMRKDIIYKTEVELLYRLSDCRSELAMIQHILAQQKEIMLKMLENRDDSRRESEANYSHSWAKVEKALETLDSYQRRTEKIDGDAERIEKTCQDLLNLKRTFASVEDSHASVLISSAAIGFAIVTIFFTPLAFLTALFALNMNAFDRLRVGNSVGDSTPQKDLPYHGGKLAGIFLGTEFLTFLITGGLVLLSLKRFDVIFGGRVKSKDKDEEEKTTWAGLKNSMAWNKRQLLRELPNIKMNKLAQRSQPGVLP